MLLAVFALTSECLFAHDEPSAERWQGPTWRFELANDVVFDSDREKLQKLVAKLAGGVAVIKAGAATEVEMKEKKAMVADLPKEEAPMGGAPDMAGMGGMGGTM